MIYPREFELDDSTDLHVKPIDDAIFHDASEECICGPRGEVVGARTLWVHNSLDGREKKEKPE